MFRIIPLAAASLLSFGCDKTSPQSAGETFLQIDDVATSLPPGGQYEAVLFYLTSYSGHPGGQWAALESMGLTEGLRERMKFVIPTIKQTAMNTAPAWFPFGVKPWESEPGASSLSTEDDLDASAEVLRKLIDDEATLLGGRYDKIFLFGFSQGGMMSHWTGLNSNVTLGGVFNYEGSFPMSALSRKFPEEGAGVAVIHMHDPEDYIVPLKYVEAGREAALAAGATNYPPVIPISAISHHGLTNESAIQVRDMLIAMLS